MGRRFERAILLGPLRGASGWRRWLRLRLSELGAERPETLRVAVDGGLASWRTLGGLEPQIAVGDWDSLPGRAGKLGRIPRLTLPRDKDWSDLYVACRAALALGARDLFCLGVTGGRPDHQLAMLLDLAKVQSARRGPGTIEVVGEEGRYHFLRGGGAPWRAQLKPGTIVSIFALGGAARGVTLRGFRYPLRGATLRPSSHGLANRPAGRGLCSVAIEQGRIVVMVLSQ